MEHMLILSVVYTVYTLNKKLLNLFLH